MNRIRIVCFLVSFAKVKHLLSVFNLDIPYLAKLVVSYYFCSHCFVIKLSIYYLDRESPKSGMLEIPAEVLF